MTQSFPSSCCQETLPFLNKGFTILVGTSGGRDSVALLRLLKDHSSAQLIVCHINHQLRSESDDEAQFVQSLAQQLHLPYQEHTCDVKTMAQEWKVSIEVAARRVRQNAFLQWSKSYDTPCVALAHHQDDQAETILLHLCRGSAGLRGMTPVSHWHNGLKVIRPLLNYSRAELTNYLKLLQQDWMEDSSNQSLDYTRNRIRHQIMPLLGDIFQRDVTQTISRSFRQDSFNSKALRQAINLPTLLDSQSRLYLPKVYEMPEELQKAVIFEYLNFIGISDISQECITRVWNILPITAPSKTNLPGGHLATRKEKRLFIIRSTTH